jgi:glycosyltransferase involved in cell wall biosynthesis
MRSVLLIAFHYPPIGGAGVQRNVQLVRRLPEHGYRPIVLTGPAPPDYRWTPADTSLADRGATPEVHRLEGLEPPHGLPWESRLERWARIPARWQRWWSANLLERATSLYDDVDLVRASVAPYAIGPAVVEIARRLARPLVLDLEDPWALDEMMVYPTRGHRRLELRKMRRVLSQADAVVMNTGEAARRVVETFPELAGRVVRAVPNAFDPADFEGSAHTRGDGRFRIVHTGSLHMDLGLRHRGASPLRRWLGGHVDGVDFLPRSHVFLVGALERLFRARPELRDVVDVHFAGVLTDAEQQSLQGVGAVTLHGFLSHRETIALVRSADLLFLPMQDLPPGRRATIVPQKTYEYVASGRPILAAVPDGDARDLLTDAGTAQLCRPSDADAMARILELETDRWRSGAEPAPPPPDVLARCGAPRLVSEIAGLFDDVLASRAG